MDRRGRVRGACRLLPARRVLGLPLVRAESRLHGAPLQARQRVVVRGAVAVALPARLLLGRGAVDRPGRRGGLDRRGGRSALPPSLDAGGAGGAHRTRGAGGSALLALVPAHAPQRRATTARPRTPIRRPRRRRSGPAASPTSRHSTAGASLSAVRRGATSDGRAERERGARPRNPRGHREGLRARRLSRSPHRHGSPPGRVHPRRAPGRAGRRPGERRAGGGRAHRHRRARGHPPARGRARRAARGLSRRGAPRRGMRRGPDRGGAHRRRSRGPGVPLRRAGNSPGARRASLDPPRRPARAGAEDGGGRAGAGLRTAQTPSDRRRGPRRGAASAGGLQRRPRERRHRAGRARSPRGCASPAAG